MPDDLLNRIMELPRETAIEAAQFVAEDVASEVSSEEIERHGAWAREKPFTHVGDVEALARVVLNAEALNGAGGAARVETAIAGAGKKNLVLGGLEIVALAGLGVIALQLILTGGKTTDEETTFGVDAKGNPFVRIRRSEKPIAITNALAAVVKPLFGGG